jgi:L-fucose isomerase-like protein
MMSSECQVVDMAEFSRRIAKNSVDDYFKVIFSAESYIIDLYLGCVGQLEWFDVTMIADSSSGFQF